ncbi:DMT family transporter [Marinomonas sp. PE14-40]|uniref:DMT family transporter n=1 Tax=Marinomonas sp. PE14-40 TaxID=3060621 RepID=UPI003F66855B
MDQTFLSQSNVKVKTLVGILCALGTICIWASWMAVTRLGVTTNLSVLDITFLRFGVAGVLLFPVIIKHGFGFKKLGVIQYIILVLGAGASYTLVAASGLAFAPASHAGVLIPGVMPLFVALLSAFFFKETFNKQRKTGYSMILIGLFIIAGVSSLLTETSYLLGHALMLTASLMWASYTIVLRHSQLEALHAVAIVSVCSFLLYLPFYFYLNGLSILDISVGTLLIQAIFQGVIATILALYLFGKAISLLGASKGASFGALVPVFAALIAIPVLNEWPTYIDWIGILVVTLGVYLASGSRLRRVN